MLRDTALRLLETTTSRLARAFPIWDTTQFWRAVMLSQFPRRPCPVRYDTPVTCAPQHSPKFRPQRLATTEISLWRFCPASVFITQRRNTPPRRQPPVTMAKVSNSECRMPLEALYPARRELNKILTVCSRRVVPPQEPGGSLQGPLQRAPCHHERSPEQGAAREVQRSSTAFRADWYYALFCT